MSLSLVRPISEEVGRVSFARGTMREMEKREIIVKTIADLESEAVRAVGALAPQEKGGLGSPQSGATLVTLSGELGAGKTAFTKAVAKALGITDTVNSPTFVLEKIYKLGHPMSKFKNLVHIDAYRLESGADLAALAFADLMRDPGNLILLEWPEMVQDGLPQPAAHISFVARDDGSRVMSYG